MRIATQSRYAIIALVDLAVHSKDIYPVNLNNISKRQNISLSYIEQLFARLKSAGIVESYRGPGGGYLLSKPAKEISIAAVVRAVDKNHTSTKEQSPTDTIWQELESRMQDYLQGIYLDSLVPENPVLEVAEESLEQQAEKLARRRQSAAIEASPAKARSVSARVARKVKPLANSVFDWGRYISDAPKA